VRITQGMFSFLPNLSDEQIVKQIEYAIEQGYSVGIEWTDDPHPRNAYWELWGLPLFDIQDSAAVMYELNECRRLNPGGYTKVSAFDASRGTESCAMSFIASRPKEEAGFYLERTEVAGRQIQYTVKSYAVQAKGEGERY
jgi:ribulose-bisphosphate carboxylase small chain